jgi:lysyl-tRNA synthetase class 2
MVTTGAIEPFIDSMELEDGLCLPTSPEISLKKVFAMYEKSCAGIYEVAHAFRNDLTGKQHLREFTMVEWYRNDYGYLELVNDVIDLIVLLGDKISPEKAPVNYRDYKIISVADIFEMFLGVRPGADWGYDEYYRLALAKKLISSQFDTQLKAGESHALTEIFTLLYDHSVTEFAKSYAGIFFIKDYPDFLRGMAKLSVQGWAMRLEAYFNNLELCSGYQELDDAGELRKIWKHNNAIRVFAGKKIHPVDENLIRITENMRDVSGMALGLERTLMALYGINDIREFKLL